MSYTIYNITDGVELIYTRSELAKTNSLLISLVLPLDRFNASCESLIAKLLLRGSNKYRTMNLLSEACDDIYGCSLDSFVYKLGESIGLSFALSVLKNEYSLGNEDILEQAIELLGNVIFSPYLPNGHFDSDYFAREKSLQYEQLCAVINNKRSLALKEAFDIMFENEPYSVSSAGDIDTLDSINEEQLTRKYFEILNYAPVKIVFSGEYDDKRLCDILKRSLPFKSRSTAMPTISYGDSGIKVKEVSHKTDADQSVLVMGFRINEDVCCEHSEAFSVFTAVFSSSPVSKLFMNVREKQQLCYYCSASTDRKKRIMVVTSGIDGKNFNKAKNSVLNELNDIKNGLISDEELDNGVKSLINSVKATNDDPSQICSYYLTKALQDSIVSLEDIIAKLLKVSKDDVVNIAKAVELDTVFLLKGEKK